MARVVARRLVNGKLSPLLIVFSLLTPLSAALAGELTAVEASATVNAIRAASNGKGAVALQTIRHSRSEIARDVVQWFALQTGNIDASFSTYARFMAEHPDWPRCIEINDKLQCDLLRKQAEQRVSSYDDPRAILAFFTANPPLTLQGLYAYASALDNAGQRSEAEIAIRNHWINASFNTSEQTDFLNRYGRVLREGDREARVDRLLWDRATDTANALLSSLNDPDFRALASARIALQKDTANVSALIAAVPSRYADDPGLAYDRARRLANKDDERAAANILLAHGTATDGKADAWWKLRERVARELLSYGDYSAAYRVASQHGIRDTTQQSYRDAEWTSGWIALRFTGHAQEAAGHFINMYKAASSVISKARGAYWMGRAAHQLGQDDTAKQWYAVAARYGTAFYGQAAAHELYGDVNIQPPTVAPPTPQQWAEYNEKDMVKAVRIGLEIGNTAVTKAFMNALADSSASQAEATMAVHLGAELRRPDLAAWAAKRIGRAGYDIPSEGYPALHFAIPGEPEASLIHAITRQESTFNTKARSPANALGLMQLLPTTAERQAKLLGLSHKTAWLTERPQHNVILGSSYLAKLIDGCAGSYICGIASYNAGPGNTAKWRDRYGYPGQQRLGVAGRASNEPLMWKQIDWIELIPFSETREYVNFVLANNEVYRAVLSRDGPVRLQLRHNLSR